MKISDLFILLALIIALHEVLIIFSKFITIVEFVVHRYAGRKDEKGY